MSSSKLHSDPNGDHARVAKLAYEMGRLCGGSDAEVIAQALAKVASDVISQGCENAGQAREEVEALAKHITTLVERNMAARSAAH